MLDIDTLSRQLAREKKARKEAEEIAETKSRVLYQTNLELIEKEHQARTLLDEFMQQDQRLAIRHKILETMMTHSALEEVAPKILQIICETLHLAEGAFWKLDENTNQLHCIYTWSMDDENVKQFAEISKQTKFPIGLGLPGRIWQTKSSNWIKDVCLDPNFPRAKYAEKAGLHSAFALPLLYDGEVLALIEFFSKDFFLQNDSLRDMLNDISTQIGMFIEREETQKRISSLSRLAGMTEVASSVLHNVGNILNSVNISAELIYEKIKNSKLKNLTLLNNLFQEHKNDLGTFLQNDDQGKKIPDFLHHLLNEWNNEKSHLLDEIQLLRQNIEQIKASIISQQAVGQTFGLTSEVNIKNLLEEALILNKINYENASIEVIHEFSPIKRVIIDRAKLFQIMINLIKNAIEALLGCNNAPKQIILRLQEKDDTNFIIQVSDNGIGILPQNLTKIFSHGFTTKNIANGYGLHSCSLFAKELGGNLSAESNGKHCGATFTLELPYILNN